MSFEGLCKARMGHFATLLECERICKRIHSDGTFCSETLSYGAFDLHRVIP